MADDVDVEVLDGLTLMSWEARRLSKGIILGLQKSRQLGDGLEFSQYRPYTQGDDIRLLDWKMYAKTGKYYVRQATISSTQHLHVIIDDSPSMTYSENGISKLQIAKLITGALTYVMTHQQDHFSWECSSKNMPKGQGFNHWRRSLVELNNLDISLQQSSHCHGYTFDGIRLWITDLYMDLHTIKKTIDIHIGPHREFVLFHIVGKDEESLDFANHTKFVDLESGEELQVNTVDYAGTYKTNLQKHISEVRAVITSKGGIYQKLYLNDNISQVLNQFVQTYNSHGNV